MANNKMVYIQKANIGKWEEISKQTNFADFVNWCLLKKNDKNEELVKEFLETLKK